MQSEELDLIGFKSEKLDEIDIVQVPSYLFGKLRTKGGPNFWIFLIFWISGYMVNMVPKI